MPQNEDMATIAAQQYYIEYGSDFTQERLQNLLPTYLPDQVLHAGSKVISYWMQASLAINKW